jgi:small subunit ribosomal protein S2
MGGSVSMGLMLKGQKTKNEGAGKDIVEEMFRAGVHYGYQKSRRHPSVSSYIYATKNKSDIINLEKTASQLSEACEFVRSVGARGKVLLLVGTKPEAKNLIKNAAEALNMPYVSERWIGGTLTNFSEIKRGILELENYRKDSTTGGLEKYTKKERLMMSKKMEKVTKYYEGLLSLKRLPDAVLLIDAKSEHIALAEALQSNIPVVALVNSDSNIKKVDYAVVGNDASIPSISYFVNALVAAFKEGTMSVPAKAEAPEIAKVTK